MTDYDNEKFTHGTYTFIKDNYKNEIFIIENYLLNKIDKEIIKNSIKHAQFRYIFEVNIKLVDVELMTKYFDVFKTNNQIIQKLVETVIVLNGSNPVKTSILKTFLKMIKKERPVRIIQ